jgi:hypothetical protein
MDVVAIELLKVDEVQVGYPRCDKLFRRSRLLA